MKIPAQARPTASPQASVEDRKGPLVSVGPNRLVTPLLSSAMVLVSIAIAYPHPRHTRRSASQRVRPALRRGSELTGAFPADVEPAQPGERVCAGHRPAIQQPAERQNTVVFDTPTRYMRRGLRPRFRRSEALSRTWWQVKDSNLRSSRDGFTDHGRQARDQRKRPFHRQLTCVFPTDIRRQPTTADGSRTPNEQLLRRLGDSRDAGRPTLVLHSHIFRRGYRPLVAQVLP